MALQHASIRVLGEKQLVCGGTSFQDHLRARFLEINTSYLQNV
jgi:hypothetical protein